MQKKIIALAIAAAFSAPAFAEVTVYGIVDAALVRSSTNAANDKAHMTILSGGLSTSRLGVVAVEDLDNGMKAVAKVEYKLDIASGAPAGTPPALTSTGDGILSARQEMVALAGGFGTVAAGTLQTTGLDFAVKFNPVAGSAVDALQSVNVGALINVGSRATHALAYISPDMGGVTVAYNRAFDAADQGDSQDGKITANLLSATYVAGPLAVGGVYSGAAVQGGVKITEMAVGASYDLGVAKLFGTYQTEKFDTTGAETDSNMSFSVVAPVGPGAVVASYALNDVKSTAGDDNSTSLTAAYLQGLSKTTTAYAALNLKTTEQGTASDLKATTLAVGLKKAF
jgi:predicted porin